MKDIHIEAYNLFLLFIDYMNNLKFLFLCSSVMAIRRKDSFGL